jgi:hypothetical protein
VVSFDFCSIIINIDDYRYKIHEVIQMIEEDDDIIGGDICMQPPSEGMVSDEDSGDENEVAINNLSSNQLHAAADAKIRKADGTTQQLISIDTEDVEDEQCRGESTDNDDTSEDEVTGRFTVNELYLL